MTDEDGTDEGEERLVAGDDATATDAIGDAAKTDRAVAAADYPDIEGLSVEAAAETIAATDDDADPEGVRSVVAHVAEDGVVTREAIDDAVAHLAKVVSTPETRLELAAMELDEAREAAEPVDDYDIVDARLSEFDERLDAVRDQVEAVAKRNRELVERDHETANLWEIAREVELVTRDANEAQRAADELASDAEEFQQWVTDPETRYDHLAGDMTALESTLSELDDGADGVERAVGDGDGGGGRQHSDPGLAWFDARVRLAMVSLLLADLHNEIETLREWADREDADTEPLAEAEDRLATLDRRHDDVADRLDELSQPAWENRFAQPLSALEGRFENMEPPVDWAAVQTTLESYRTVVG
jgi:DNA repair ATPase RecN